MEINKLYELACKSAGVCTDSRNVMRGSLFIALRGKSHNGNKFASAALAAGASFAVVDDDKFFGKQCIKVSNTLETLQQLAAFHRKQFNIPVVAVTGSNGKTTTKELINAVLSRKFRTHCTHRNLNNHIGLPLTLLSMKKDAEIAVLEMGANHLGEIEQLCAIANPTHGIITNIGKAHIGAFGSFKNIVIAKSELHRHLLHHGGVVFINSNDPVVGPMKGRFREPVLYPAKGSFCHCEMAGADPYIVYRSENGDTIRTYLAGSYNFENIAAALTIGKFFGVNELDANDAIASYVPDNMRSQVISKDPHTILLDAYNANPTSMEAAIANFDKLVARHKVVIIGDMFDLGDQEIAEHQQLGKLLREKDFDAVYLCGKLVKEMTDDWPEANYYPSRDELMSAISNTAFPPSAFLIKASRGMGLEKVVEAIN